MVFKNEKGEIDGPHVMKHWRQDWTWQDAEIHAYAGYSTWQREKSSHPEGRWSQAVFQVDDSPRYKVMGAWTHSGGLSTWRSDNCPRPLPRREFSVRKDYNVLEGFHEITLAPNGWIHVQNNRKLQLEPDGSRRYLVSGLFSASSRPFAYQAYISVYAIYIIPSPDRRFHDHPHWQ